MSGRITDVAAGAGEAAGTAAPAGGVVIPFPGRRPADNLLATRDRIALLAWLDGTAAAGIARAVIEHCDCTDDPATVGDFVLFYRRDTEWASWALAPSHGGYHVWEMAYGQTLGLCDTLAMALALITRALERDNGSSISARQAAPGKASRTGTTRSAAAPSDRRIATG